MRRSARIILVVAASPFATACFAYQPVDPPGPGRDQRVQIASDTPFALAVRAPGVDSLRLCRAVELRGSFASAAADTLVLHAPFRIVPAPGEAPCATPKGATARVAPRPADVSVYRADVSANLIIVFTTAMLLSLAIRQAFATDY